MERLDEAELDAVISHEVGHVRDNDVVVMAVLTTIPITLYYSALCMRSNEAGWLAAIGAYAGYLVAELAVLSVGRSREFGADRWSCRVTGDGDALCSALVKIAYGMGQVDAELSRRAAEAADDSDKTLAEDLRRQRRVRSAGMMGISDGAHGATMLAAHEQAAHEQGLRADEVIGALRWDSCNPWARFEQLLSTHPLVMRRILALQDSGLPGAPRRWDARAAASTCRDDDLTGARRRFAIELVVRFGPVIALVLVAVAWETGRYVLLAQAVVALGLAVMVQAGFESRPGPFRPVDRVSSLLTRLDAGPVTGLPVSVRGRVIGRGSAGYVLSPDLVIQDASGFLPVLYTQPWPFARQWFGLLRVPELLGQDVVVRGWYRREPHPVLEMRDLTPSYGRRVSSSRWIASLLLGAAIALGGGMAWLIQWAA